MTDSEPDGVFEAQLARGEAFVLIGHGANEQARTLTPNSGAIRCS